MKIKLLLSSSTCFILAVFTAQADPVISVNLTHASAQAITSPNTFGIASLGTDVGGWNNPINLYSMANLAYSDASSSTVGFTLADSSGSYATFNAAYAGTPLAGGPDVYVASAGTITLNNLNANFANGYWIIAYIGGFNAATGGSISDGTSTYFYRPDPAPVNPYGTFVQTTQTTDLGAGANPIAQYAVFGSSSSPLTSDSLTLTLATSTGAAGGEAFGGFQIIGAAAPVPEPAPLSLALLGGAGLWIIGRRKWWNQG